MYFKQSAFFVLRLPAQNLLGLVGKAAYPPIFTWYVYHGWHIPIRFYFSFIRFSPTPWIFLALASQRCMIWIVSWGLRYVLEGFPLTFCLCYVFRGGSKVVCVTWGFFLRDLILRTHPDFIRGIPLISGLPRPFGRYLVAGFLGSSWYCGSFLEKSPKYLEGLLHKCEWFPEKSSPCLLVLYYCNGKGLNDIFYLISDGITLVALYPHFMWGGENKIEVIEELLVLFFGFYHYYWLTLSRSDFANWRTLHAMDMG